jgi:ribosomal protein S18 acetylase RimI-like enzyme
VVYKLYIHRQHRGRGLGPQLIDALARQLPADADWLYIEHFVANERAGAF